MIELSITNIIIPRLLTSLSVFKVGAKMMPPESVFFPAVREVYWFLARVQLGISLDQVCHPLYQSHGTDP